MFINTFFLFPTLLDAPFTFILERIVYAVPVRQKLVFPAVPHRLAEFLRFHDVHQVVPGLLLCERRETAVNKPCTKATSASSVLFNGNTNPYALSL